MWVDVISDVGVISVEYGIMIIIERVSNVGIPENIILLCQNWPTVFDSSTDSTIAILGDQCSKFPFSRPINELYNYIVSYS